MTYGVTAAREPTTTSLITALEAQIYPTLSSGGRDASRCIGDAKAPEPLEGSASPGYPYAVVHGIDGGALWGGEYEDMFSGGRWPYQVTSVGRTRQQAEWMSDLVRSAILGRHSDGTAWNVVLDPVTVIGAGSPWVVVDRALESAAAAVEVGRLFNVAERYLLWVTPSN